VIEGVRFLHTQVFLKMERIPEAKSGELPGEPWPRDEGAPFFVNAGMGQGTEGVDRACDELAREIRKRRFDASVGIACDPDVPVGLVMEGFRRFSEVSGVAGVCSFTGKLAPPLAGIDFPSLKTARAIDVRVDADLLHDALDGFPAMVVSARSERLLVDLPSAPQAGSSPSHNGFEQLGSLMKEFASLSRNPKDPILSNGWLVIRMPAETPCGVLLALMQESCSAGIGLWKIRVLLPGNHPFRGPK
jgi:hypothetical protein